MKEVTGRHVLMWTVGAFGIIIAVNVTMAVQAVRTFPGLEVENSYVASQSFDQDRAAQEALGWQAKADYQKGTLVLRLEDKSGAVVLPARLESSVGRTTHVRDDVTPAFQRDDGVYRANLPLEPGLWNLRLQAADERGTQYRVTLPFRVSVP